MIFICKYIYVYLVYVHETCNILVIQSKIYEYMNLVERNLIIKYIVYAMYYNVQYLYAYEHSNVF